jgi:hypothetical protein
MRISIKLFVVIATSWFVVEPMAFGQNNSTPPRPTDISGSWLMEFGTCKGSISISPPLNSDGDNWNGIWTGQCGSDALGVQFTISEKYETVNPSEVNREGGGGYPYEGNYPLDVPNAIGSNSPVANVGPSMRELVADIDRFCAAMVRPPA